MQCLGNEDLLKQKDCHFESEFISHFQAETKANWRKPYEKVNLLWAYEATKSVLSVYRASRLYNVPESTLHDWTRGKQPSDIHLDPERIFPHKEEQNMVEHIAYMSGIGYGYSNGNIQYMAADYAKSLGKSVKAANGLGENWFRGLRKRWPDLKTIKPQKLG